MQITVTTGIRLLAYFSLCIGAALLLWRNHLWNQPGLWLALCAVVLFWVGRIRDKRSYQSQKLMLSSIIDNIPTAIYLKDSNGVYLLNNKQFEHMLGKTREQITGKRDEDLFSRERAIRCRQDDTKVMTTEQMLEYEESLLTTDGSCTFINKKFPIRKPDGSVNAVCGLLVDITGYKTVSENFARSSRAYQVLSRINSGMQYAASEGDWLQDVCRHLVELGGYRMAWIGVAQRAGGQFILPVADAGDEFDYLATVKLGWKQLAVSQHEPCGVAVRERRSVVINDLELEADEDWRNQALRRGYMAMYCLPILQGKNVLGDEIECMLLCLYSTRKGAFDDAEMTLMKELANDVGFGVRSLRERAANLRTHLALAEEKQKFEKIVQGVNAGVVLINNQHSIVWANEQFRRWFCQHEDYVGLRCDKCMVAGGDEAMLLSNGVLGSGEIQFRSAWIRDSQGENRYFDMVAAPLLNERHEIIQIVELIVDVTDRKYLEDDRQKVVRQLHAAQRIARIGSWELNIKTGRFDWSDEVYRIFDIEFGKFESSYPAFLKMVLSDDRHNVDRIYHESVRKRVPFEVVHRVRLKDGRNKYVHERCETEYADNGEALRSVGTVQDITDQVVVEQALLESEEHYRRLIESSTAIPWEMDAADMQYSFVGSQAEKIFGISSQRWCEKGFWLTHLHPDDREKIQQLYQNKISHGENFEAEFRLLDINGKTQWVRDTVNVLREPGMPVRLQGFMFDITDQRNAEEMARRNQKMDAVGQLTGGIAHDFNNQLGVIQGYLEFLSEFVRGKEKPQHWVASAAGATRRCIDLSRKLLDFSRKKAIAVESVNVNDVLNKMRDLIARSVTSRIRVDYRPDTKPGWILVNSGELEDAILNLVINARDAMPESGQLTLATENIEITQDALPLYPGMAVGNYVLVSISDTGMGISSENRERIFEPFFTTKGEGMGTGLGLAMVYSFVKRSSGVIQVYSEPGEGSIFQIYFPHQEANISDTEKNGPAVDDLAAWRGHGEVVLLVDDEESLREVAANYLQRAGYYVLEAEHAAAALKILRSGTPVDVLFSDVIMPGINGYQLAEQALQLQPTLKILLTSGFTGNAAQKSNFDFPLLNKPYNKVELARAIHVLLDRPPAEVSAEDVTPVIRHAVPVVAAPDNAVINRRKRLVVLDDEVSMGQLVCDVADSMEMDAEHFAHASEYIVRHGELIDVLILDLMMPDLDGIEMIRLLAGMESKVPLILISGVDKSVLHSARELAYEHKLNVIGTLQKPFLPNDLKALLQSNELQVATVKPVQKTLADEISISEQELRDAVKQQQFVPWFQPQISLQDSSVVGFEALMRWKHPQRGLIPPYRFIPLAEETGLIDEMTWQLFDQIAADWKRFNLRQSVSLNMTAGMFKNLDLPDRLQGIGSRHQFDNNGQIVLEVTESALMGELTKSLDSLTRLRMKGYHLSIDDFGTGFSSMLQLYRAPFTELKIDQSFVMRMEKNMEARTIVESTINLAHNLNMKVVAEGVETESILRRLDALSCDIAQGYFIARPMPIEDAMVWMENWNAKVAAKK